MDRIDELSGRQMYELFAAGFAECFNQVMNPSAEDTRGLDEGSVVVAKAATCAVLSAVAEHLEKNGVGGLADNMIDFGMPGAMVAQFMAIQRAKEATNA